MGKAKGRRSGRRGYGYRVVRVKEIGMAVEMRAEGLMDWSLGVSVCTV